MNRAKGSPLQKDGLIRNKIWPTACFYGKLPRQLRKGNGEVRIVAWHTGGGHGIPPPANTTVN